MLNRIPLRDNDKIVFAMLPMSLKHPMQIKLTQQLKDEFGNIAALLVLVVVLPWILAKAVALDDE